jgi:hypothetical protein
MGTSLIPRKFESTLHFTTRGRWRIDWQRTNHLRKTTSGTV